MQWREAKFHLSNGDEFALMHTLPLSGEDSIEAAFNYWADNKASGENVKDFINFLNRRGVIRAMTLEKYKALQTPAGFGDNSLMPFGKFKGKRMIEIPAYYLILIYDKGWIYSDDVRKYIIDNMTALQQEAKKNKSF